MTDFVLQMNIDQAYLSHLSLFHLFIYLFFSLRVNNYQDKKKFKMYTAMSPLQKNLTGVCRFLWPALFKFFIILSLSVKAGCDLRRDCVQCHLHMAHKLLCHFKQDKRKQ